MEVSIYLFNLSLIDFKLQVWCRKIPVLQFKLNLNYKFVPVFILYADTNGRAVKAWFLRPFDCWDCGFETRRGHGCLSLVNDVCCEAQISASARSLIQGECY
jgi:hypothetical protein